MRHMPLTVLALLIALLLCGCSGKQESAAAPKHDPDRIIAVVNGQELKNSDFEAYRQSYEAQFSEMGANQESNEITAYIEDNALTACIQDMLIQQDMEAQGCFTFDEETERWLTEAGTAAFERALTDVGTYLRDTLQLEEGADLDAAARKYAAETNVTAQNYIDVYREQYACTAYYAWLMRDCPVTDAEIEQSYQSCVEADKAAYENNVEAFETAIASNQAVWYQPAGYRSVLQILLKAEGETAEEKLASVHDTVRTIYSLLENGESFPSLIAAYGSDANLKDTSFLETGYSVHPDSVIWDDSFIAAAFAEDMAAPGSWSTTPLVSDSGVHILYYLRDLEGGPAELTDSVREALAHSIYQLRLNEQQKLRLETLSATAQVTYPENNT